MFTCPGCRRSLQSIRTNRAELWLMKSNRILTISKLVNCTKRMALQPHIPPSSVHFAIKKHLLNFVKCLWNSHDTPTCYLLSHCQFEHTVYLSTSSVAKRCLHIYQDCQYDYSAWVVTLSVLELVQLADIFRFIVVYWVKGMNRIELAHESSIAVFLSAENNSC
jgi:hypothetical protein